VKSDTDSVREAGSADLIFYFDVRWRHTGHRMSL
jgi:hypothetical protein